MKVEVYKRDVYRKHNYSRKYKFELTDYILFVNDVEQISVDSITLNNKGLRGVNGILKIAYKKGVIDKPMKIKDVIVTKTTSLYKNY